MGREDDSRMRLQFLIDALEIHHVVGDEDHVPIDGMARYQVVATSPQTPKPGNCLRRKAPVGSYLGQLGA